MLIVDKHVFPQDIVVTSQHEGLYTRHIVSPFGKIGYNHSYLYIYKYFSKAKRKQWLSFNGITIIG